MKYYVSKNYAILQKIVFCLRDIFWIVNNTIILFLGLLKKIIKVYTRQKYS